MVSATSCFAEDYEYFNCFRAVAGWARYSRDGWLKLRLTSGQSFTRKPLCSKAERRFSIRADGCSPTKKRIKRRDWHSRSCSAQRCADRSIIPIYGLT